MKRLLATFVAVALVTPSIAAAKPAAQSLSLSNAAAVQPVRASALTAKKLRSADDPNTLYYVLGAIAVGGLIGCVADLCKSKSN
ncbi:MAG: hypothetical protein P8J20_18300 [Novosphingobium sp.]|nr:hypothetical protein [Novosphingobium sp.]